jgi:hypothetical protein
MIHGKNINEIGWRVDLVIAVGAGNACQGLLIGLADLLIKQGVLKFKHSLVSDLEF